MRGPVYLDILTLNWSSSRRFSRSRKSSALMYRQYGNSVLPRLDAIIDFHKIDHFCSRSSLTDNETVSSSPAPRTGDLWWALRHINGKNMLEGSTHLPSYIDWTHARPTDIDLSIQERQEPDLRRRSWTVCQKHLDLPAARTADAKRRPEVREPCCLLTRGVDAWTLTAADSLTYESYANRFCTTRFLLVRPQNLFAPNLLSTTRFRHPW